MYVDLVRSLDGQRVVPRDFFELPVLRGLDSVYVAPVRQRMLPQ